MNLLRRTIKARAKSMLEMYDLSGGVEHDAEKGAFREFFLSCLIRPLLPVHFGVGSGVLVDAYGRQSMQSDVVVYDRRQLPPVLLAGDRGVFPLDSVLCVVEVKSTLTATDYDQIVPASRRIAPLTKKNPDGMRIAIPGKEEDGSTTYPLFAVFAYKADAKKDEVERLRAKYPSGYDTLRLICVLDKGVWCLRQGAPHLSEDPSENSVFFMSMLLNRIEEVAGTRGDYRLQDWLFGSRASSGSVKRGPGFARCPEWAESRMRSSPAILHTELPKPDPNCCCNARCDHPSFSQRNLVGSVSRP